jgi:hypothetical protein
LIKKILHYVPEYLE